MRSKIFNTILLLICSTAFAQKIYVNQAGNLLKTSKLVYFSNSTDSFFVWNDQTKNIVFRGNASLFKTADPSTGLTIYRGDYSSFSTPGKYYITDKNGNKSYTFTIGDTVFNSVFKKSLKGFYFQRCGVELLLKHAGLYKHPQCHFLTDGNYHSTTDTAGHAFAIGGWHDAGDYGKYVVNAGISVGTLLMAYEMFPKKFAADDLNIPESGNGIPDILDEVKFELDWLFTMQRPNGAVFTKLTREQFEGFVMPQNDNVSRFIYTPSATATADFVAMMARAYRVFKKYDADYAAKCLNAAKKSWSYLESNPQIFPVGGFKNPAGTATGEYGDGNDTDERLWAAAELFASTGDEKIHFYYLSNYSKSGLFTKTMGWPSVGPMAQLTYLLTDVVTADQNVKNEHKTALINYCNTLVQRSKGDGFNVAITGSEYNWGCNSDILNKAILLIAGYLQNNSQEFYNTALYQLNFVLGANAHDLSFVTGVGSKYPMNIHHRPSGADGIKEPVPGLIAGGPNKNINQDPALARTFTSSTPPALCFIDHQDSYASNEICINWNAPLVYVAGFFNGEGMPTALEKKKSELPAETRLKQNYPNPFNPETKISFEIDNSVIMNEMPFTTLKIYDVLGNEVAVLVNERKSSGYYEVNWNAAGFPSGVYFYTLAADNSVTTKKMMLVK